MNFFVEFTPQEKLCQELDSLPPDVLSVPDKFYWIDIEEKNATEEHEILKTLNIEKSSLENYFSDSPIPLYEQTDNYINLDLLSFKLHESKVTNCKFKAVIGKNFILTLHAEPLVVIDQIKQEYKKNFLIAGKTTGFLVFLIFDFYISDVLQTMFGFDRELEDIENEISEGRFTEQVFQDIFRIRRNIHLIKKSVEPASSILMKISTRKTPFISEECLSYMKNLDSNMERVSADLDSFREMIMGIMEFHMSIASKRMNEVMKLLSLVATIMMPMTFLCGLYGMNFEHMPELGWRYSYYAFLGTMGIVAIALFFIFKIKKWF